MIGVLRRGRAQQAATGLEDCAERAGVLYDGDVCLGGAVIDVPRAERGAFAATSATVP